MKSYGIVLFFLIVPFASTLAQSDLLKGRLVDASTIEPMAFATIAVKGGALGVISNYDGSFSVPEKLKAYGDTLQISSMGFENREILISTLSVDKVRTIYMQPALFELEEAVVTGKRKRKLSARQIVGRAIKNIPTNYPRNLFSMVGYYRDYQLKSGEYINLNEAIFEVFDYGFAAVDTSTTKVQIFDYKKNDEFKRDSLAQRPYDYKRLQKIVDNAFLQNYGGNEFTILRVHDAIRNYNLNSYSFVNRFDFDLLENHNFSRDNSTYINNEAVYSIKFRKKHPSYTAYGTLYISHRDFAIHKMEYTVYDDRKKLPKDTLNKHKGRGQLLFETVTEYRRKYNKMYLNYISFNNGFILWEPPKFKLDFVTLDLPRQCFVLNFNRMPNESDALNVDKYIFRYNGKRLKFYSVVVFENKVFLFPDMDQEEKLAMVEKLLEDQENEVDLKESISVKVKPIIDVDGNVLNKWKKRDYNQFREYFVQRVKPKTDLPQEGKFMNKRKPIFKDQPIVRPDNFDDYWMNTPLQKLDIKKPVEQ